MENNKTMIEVAYDTIKSIIGEIYDYIEDVDEETLVAMIGEIAGIIHFVEDYNRIRRNTTL